MATLVYRRKAECSFNGIGVYAWVRRGEYLYIGKSTCVSNRLRSHGIVGRLEPFQAIDRILVWPMDSFLIASLAEVRMIWSLKPAHNMTHTRPEACKGCGRILNVKEHPLRRYCYPSCPPLPGFPERHHERFDRLRHLPSDTVTALVKAERAERHRIDMQARPHIAAYFASKRLTR